MAVSRWTTTATTEPEKIDGDDGDAWRCRDGWACTRNNSTDDVLRASRVDPWVEPREGTLLSAAHPPR